MNTVNSGNFNQTLDGYVNHAIDFLIEDLQEEGFSSEQISKIVRSLNIGIYRAKDYMTMEEARSYTRKK